MLIGILIAANKTALQKSQDNLAAHANAESYAFPIVWCEKNNPWSVLIPEKYTGISPLFFCNCSVYSSITAAFAKLGTGTGIVFGNLYDAKIDANGNTLQSSVAMSCSVGAVPAICNTSTAMTQVLWGSCSS
jgi:hypothetical protein